MCVIDICGNAYLEKNYKKEKKLKMQEFEINIVKAQRV